jgi:hypothetical protein
VRIQGRVRARGGSLQIEEQLVTDASLSENYNLLYRNCRKLWPLVRSSFVVIVKDECHLLTQCKTVTYFISNFFFQVTCLAYENYVLGRLVNIINNSNRSCNFFDISFSRVTTEYSSDEANDRYSV